MKNFRTCQLQCIQLALPCITMSEFSRAHWPSLRLDKILASLSHSLTWALAKIGPYTTHLTLGRWPNVAV